MIIAGVDFPFVAASSPTALEDSIWSSVPVSSAFSSLLSEVFTGFSSVLLPSSFSSETSDGISAGSSFSGSSPGSEIGVTSCTGGSISCPASPIVQPFFTKSTTSSSDLRSLLITSRYVCISTSVFFISFTMSSRDIPVMGIALIYGSSPT